MKTRFASLRYIEMLPEPMKAALKSILTPGVEVPDICRKSFDIEEGTEERTFTAVASTDSVDRDGEVILPSGIGTKAFDANPCLLWSHNWQLSPVGSVIEHEKLEDKFVIKAQMASTPFAQDLWTLIKEKHLRTLSVGFLPVEIFHAGDKNYDNWAKKNPLSAPRAKRIFARTELLEISLCSIPANSSAIITAIKSLNPETMEAFGVVKAADPAEIEPKLLHCLISEPVDDDEIIKEAIKEALQILSGRI